MLDTLLSGFLVNGWRTFFLYTNIVDIWFTFHILDLLLTTDGKSCL